MSYFHVILDPSCDVCTDQFFRARALGVVNLGNGEPNCGHKKYICVTCDLKFSTFVELQGHWSQSQRHRYCQGCNMHFRSRRQPGGLIDHYVDRHPYCESCSQLFDWEDELEEHFRQSPNHNYCSVCRKHYRYLENLRNVRVSRPVKFLFADFCLFSTSHRAIVFDLIDERTTFIAIIWCVLWYLRKYGFLIL
jgi:hypothetical protein